jgi:hypothetical protein
MPQTIFGDLSQAAVGRIPDNEVIDSVRRKQGVRGLLKAHGVHAFSTGGRKQLNSWMEFPEKTQLFSGQLFSHTNL